MKTRLSFALLALILLAPACNPFTGSDGTTRPISNIVAERPTAMATFLASPIAVRGVTYYVGKEACDDNGMGDKQSPFCSFAAALGRLQPGDALIIRPGSYPDRLAITGLAGRAEAPIIIRGEERDSVILDGGCPGFPCGLADVAWPWDEETGLITLENSQFVILRDLTVQNSIAVGVNVLGGNGITVEQIAVRGTGHAGMLFQHTSNLTVAQNEVQQVQLGWREENGQVYPGAHESLSVVAVTNFVVRGNYVHDSLKEGIDVKESSSDGEVSDNFVERTCLVGIYINEAHRIAVHHNQVRRSGYFLNGNGRERLCAEQPTFGGQYGQYYGGGILLAVGDLGDLSQGRLSDIALYQNLVWDVVGNGLEFWDELRESHRGQGEMSGNRIFNNTFYNTSLAGIRLMDVSDSSVINNIIALNQEDSITGNAADANTLSHNLFFFYQDGQQPEGNAYVIGDPQFADPARGDFRLTPGSPAIDAGLDVGLSFKGGAPDIGAFEYE